MYVKPAEGRRLRDPRTMMPVPPEGVAVPDMDPHWMALVRMGDVEIVDPPKAALPGADEPDEPATEERI